MVITASLSKKLFGDENAVGKMVKIDNQYNFKVSGVLKDLPGNTQFNFEYLLPWSHMSTTHQDDSCWACSSTHNYALLKPNTNAVAFNAKIRDLIKVHTEPGTTLRPFLYPVSKLRLYGDFQDGAFTGKIESIKIFTIIAVLILFIACINFMNMSTARSEKRAKEVGIRKVAGAARKSLVIQFIGESIFISFIAGLLALLIVQLSLPAFSAIIGREMIINKPVIREFRIDFSSGYFLLFFFGFILFTGLMAGSYPAFFLSSFRPVDVLKGTFKKAHSLVTPRKVLVVLQFTFSVILIICTIIIQRQIKYTQSRQTGYDKSNLVYIPLAGNMAKNYTLIKNELLSKSIVTGVSKTSAPITEGWSSGGANWDGEAADDNTEFNYFNSDGDIVKTSGLTLLQGRDIDVKNYPTDSSAVLLNEAAAKVMGFQEPVGKIINPQDNGGWHIIGVVKNFILQTPYDPIKPMIIRGPKADWFNVIHVKFSGAMPISQSLSGMEKVFKQYNPDYPFEYYFVDEKYAAKFSSEQTTATLTAFFAGLTIFISCLGLFGLAAYMAESRIKEIGVRKVLGATVANITVMLSQDFIRLVIIAIVMATPVAWWAMNRWLSGYSYHTDISWWIFLVAGFAAIVIALGTVSFQAIKAALANPVKSLRNE